MSPRARAPWWAELPLVAVSLATVVGFIRVYEGWDFLVPLLGFSLGAHALAIGTRRLQAPWFVATLIAVAGAAVAVAVILFPETTTFGVFPSAATWDAASAALRVARSQYPVVIAPTEVLAGFQLAAGLALWIAAWFGDRAAHRLHATLEALTAITAIFVFCAVLGSGRYEIACAAVFAAAVLLFVGVQRSMAIERDHLGTTTDHSARNAVLRSTGVLAVVAIAVGVLVAPSLPGARSEAAIEWRGGQRADGSRVTISPMVEIKKRLVQQSDLEVFRVRTSEPAYWRLTSLDSFDGEIWSSSGEFTRAGERLPSDAPAEGLTSTIRQDITIEALEAIWAPTAFEAVSVRETETPLRWDPDSSTLIVDASEPTSDGLRYSVVSRAPMHESIELAAAGGEDPASIRARYLGLPTDFPFLASNLAREVTATAGSRYEQALALQDWFRSEFDYSLEPEPGHGDDALVAFLRSGEGYCEQFAGTFAAMARSLGIPARVAVGFTPGTPDPTNPDLYRVYGRHAHAWPEVYFPGTGWVAFEPTPGRGIPGAEGYTGVPAQQDAISPAETTSTTTTATSTPVTADDPPSPTTTPVSQRAETAGATTGAEGGDAGGGGSTPWGFAAVVLTILVAAAIVFLGRRRAAAQRHRDLPHPDQVWERVVRALALRRGIEADPAQTHAEVARRAAAAVGADADALARIADLVASARWSADGLDEADTTELDRLADQVIDGLKAPAPDLAPTPG